MCYERYEHHFSDLRTAVDDLQAHFKNEIAAPAAPNAVDSLCRLNLAVHEWMTNLMRHAHFGPRAPEVHVRVWEENSQFCCTIEDNSAGFNLAAQRSQREDAATLARRMPDGGMGLQLLFASTERAAYAPLGEARNRLSLSVIVLRDRRLRLPRGDQ